MELIMTKAGRGRKPQKIKITDCEGNFKIFDSVVQAAEYLECASQTLHNYLQCGKKIRGCTIEKA